MSHDAECDITLYGSTPGVQGVICTCDDGADSGDAGDDWKPPPAPVKRRPRSVPEPGAVTLTGAAAIAFGELRAAEDAVRAAIRRRDAAVAALLAAEAG